MASRKPKDAELAVMDGVVELIETLPDKHRYRVIEYLNERYLEGMKEPVYSIPPARFGSTSNIGALLEIAARTPMDPAAPRNTHGLHLVQPDAS